MTLPSHDKKTGGPFNGNTWDTAAGIKQYDVALTYYLKYMYNVCYYHQPIKQNKTTGLDKILHGSCTTLINNKVRYDQLNRASFRSSESFRLCGR